MAVSAFMAYSSELLVCFPHALLLSNPSRAVPCGEFFFDDPSHSHIQTYWRVGMYSSLGPEGRPRVEFVAGFGEGWSTSFWPWMDGVSAVSLNVSGVWNVPANLTCAKCVRQW